MVRKERKEDGTVVVIMDTAKEQTEEGTAAKVAKVAKVVKVRQLIGFVAVVAYFGICVSSFLFHLFMI